MQTHPACRQLQRKPWTTIYFGQVDDEDRIERPTIERRRIGLLDILARLDRSPTGLADRVSFRSSSRLGPLMEKMVLIPRRPLSTPWRSRAGVGAASVREPTDQPSRRETVINLCANVVTPRQNDRYLTASAFWTRERYETLDVRTLLACGNPAVQAKHQILPGRQPNVASSTRSKPMP